MSQTFTDNCFSGGHIVEDDLEAMENNFAALRSLFSGSTAPSNAVPFMPWGDTSKKFLKMRNATNAVWWGLFHGNASQKMWVYRNSAMDGYAVDTGVTDQLVAMKGGATYTTGGATAGSWTVDIDHVHKWYESNQPGSKDHVWDDDGTTILMDFDHCVSDYTTNDCMLCQENWAIMDYLDDAWTSENGGTSAWRPAAAVGTLQYLDL